MYWISIASDQMSPCSFRLSSVFSDGLSRWWLWVSGWPGALDVPRKWTFLPIGRSDFQSILSNLSSFGGSPSTDVINRIMTCIGRGESLWVLVTTSRLKKYSRDMRTSFPSIQSFLTAVENFSCSPRLIQATADGPHARRIHRRGMDNKT